MGILSKLVVPAPIQAGWGLLKRIPPQVWMALGLVFLVWGYGHHRYNAGEAAQLARDNAKLQRAAESLRAANDAIRDINAAAERRLAEEAAAKRAAEDAGAIAAAQAAELQRRVAGFGRELERARRRPTCAALLAMDVAKECGL